MVRLNWTHLVQFTQLRIIYAPTESVSIHGINDRNVDWPLCRCKLVSLTFSMKQLTNSICQLLYSPFLFLFFFFKFYFYICCRSLFRFFFRLPFKSDWNNAEKRTTWVTWVLNEHWITIRSCQTPVLVSILSRASPFQSYMLQMPFTIHE